MADTVFTIGKGLVIATTILPFALGWPALLVAVAHDEWQLYHRRPLDMKFSGRGRKSHLLNVAICAWLLIVTAVLYAGLLMHLWEEAS